MAFCQDGKRAYYWLSSTYRSSRSVLYNAETNVRHIVVHQTSTYTRYWFDRSPSEGSRFHYDGCLCRDPEQVLNASLLITISWCSVIIQQRLINAELRHNISRRSYFSPQRKPALVASPPPLSLVSMATQLGSGHVSSFGISRQPL